MDTSLFVSETISNTDDPVAAPTPFDLELITITRRELVELNRLLKYFPDRVNELGFEAL